MCVPATKKTTLTYHLSVEPDNKTLEYVTRPPMIEKLMQSESFKNMMDKGAQWLAVGVRSEYRTDWDLENGKATITLVPNAEDVERFKLGLDRIVYRDI